MVSDLAHFRRRGGASLCNHNTRERCNVAFDQYLSTVVLRALRPIRKHEELFVDYGSDYWRKIDCFPGAPPAEE